MKCQFEERQFESHLNIALAADENIHYVPGQVLEGTLGFDAAVHSSHPAILGLFPWVLGRGIALRHEWWSGHPLDPDVFPPFRFNVFLQHKRPEYLASRTAKEWQFWKRAYYRYNLTPHQQSALESLALQVGKDAVVAYASPAFWKLDSLWDALRTRTLADKTNFVDAASLKGHRRYTYANADGTGWACSEPTPVETFELAERMSVLRRREPARSNTDFVKQLGRQIDAAMESPRDGPARRAASLYGRIIAHADDRLRSERRSELLGAFSRVGAFSFVSSSTWFVGL